MVDEKNNEENIFHAAIAKPVSERADYLRTACGNNPELLSHIENLLRVYDAQDDFLEVPPWGEDITLNSSSLVEGPGTVIGRYKLLERIGEGGMAVVYMAEQDKPIHRKVALKIIKLGMDTKSVIARFEAERQALALMDHPNIAKVLDAGSTETGRPYFVMELVTGVSITEYSDKNNLSTKERLSLFIQVCKAVQHAHQKGIIHRDIKPTNVMVTRHEGQPIPKVIDFGISKATKQRLTEKTLFTRYAHIIGTPAYMSPEQAELSDLDVDTRSDIYSLGVLLYELLTGTTPFSEDELRKAGYLEMQRVIREQEPPKPSTKLSTLGETLADIAKYRGSTPDLLTKAIRGDLDWIVMKTLEKDRARRYETANGLADDIRRHIEHEPVLARGPGTMYRLHKFLRRHRSKTIAALAMLAIAGALTVILSMWNRDRLQLAKAEALTHESILYKARESYAKGDRKKALGYVESILNSNYVGPDAQLLSASIRVDERLYDDAVAVLENLLELENLLDERPEIAGAAYALLARALWESESLDVEKLKEIEEHQRRAEALLPETAEAYFLRAMTAPTIKEKLELLDEALDIDRGHYESRRLRAFIYYACQKYDKMEHDAYAMALLQLQNPLGYSLRAMALRELGQFEDALAEYNKAIELTPRTDPSYTDLHSQRCEILLSMSDYEQVIEAGRECLEHLPDKIVFHFYVFSAFTALGAYEEAAMQYHQMINADPHSRNRFRDLCTKRVFDTLGAGQLWHPPDSEPKGAAFFFMLEADKTYRQLSAKTRRLISNGFEPCWSPNGSKLAFGLGVIGNSGIAVFDLASQEIDLLIVPGTTPRWSPDGQNIAFVRGRQFLSLAELTAIESKKLIRSTPAEVWIMKADGTDPRRLARGDWPSWSPDSKHIYFIANSNMLCSIPFEDREAEPKPIMAFSGYTASVSPDNRHVAYVTDHQFLKIKDLDSQTLITDWAGPPRIFAGHWSADSQELSIGGYYLGGWARDQTGLWIYDLDRKQAAKVLDGQITTASWTPDGRKLAFALEQPLTEIWVADLDPNVSTAESLGSVRTLEQHYQEMVSHYTRMIEANPVDAEGYFLRAQYHDFLGDQESHRADMDIYVTICNSTVHRIGTPTNLGATVNSSLRDGLPNISEEGLELYFTSNRPGGSGGYDICVTRRETIHGQWGEPVNLGPPINSADDEHDLNITSNGLELYFSSNRSGGSGGVDLWVIRRTNISKPWGEPVNLGPTVNSSADEVGISISKDGLSLIFDSSRSGGYGSMDLWVSTRPTLSGSWGAPENLGSTVNSSDWDYAPALSSDGLTLFFTSARSGSHEIWLTSRETTNERWGGPVNLGPEINSLFGEGNPNISADGSTLYFVSGRPGGSGDADIWQVEITSLLGSLQSDGDVETVQKLLEGDNGKEVVPLEN